MDNNDDDCSDGLERVSVWKIKLMDDDEGNDFSTAAFPIDVPVKDLLPHVSEFHYEAMEVLSLRQFSTSGVAPKRHPRFRFLIFKGRKQFKNHIYSRYDGFSCTNLHELLIEKFYLKLFANEDDELTKMIKDDDMWHILLVGYRLPTDKEFREHDTLIETRRKQNIKWKKKNSKKVHDDDDPIFFPKSPSFWHIVGACSFKLLKDDNSTIYMPWIAVTDEKACMKDWNSFGKNNKPKGIALQNLQLLYDEKKFSGGKGMGKTMIAVLQYISSLISQSRISDESKRVPLTLLCESNKISLQFYKVGIGMIEFDRYQKDAIPNSVKDKMLFTYSLTPLKLYEAAFEVRPPRINSIFLDVEKLLQNALINIYRVDRQVTQESIFGKISPKLTIPESSFCFQPKPEHVDKLLSKRQMDLQHTFTSQKLKNLHISKNSRLSTIQASAVLENFFGFTEGDVELCPMSLEFLGFGLLRCFIYDYIQALPVEIFERFHKGEEYDNLYDWFFGKSFNQSLDQERQFLIFFCWHIAKMSAQVPKNEYNNTSKYSCSEQISEEELHQHSWVSTISEKGERALTDFERTYMTGPLIESILNIKKTSRRTTKSFTPLKLQETFHLFANLLASPYDLDEDKVADVQLMWPDIAERHATCLVLLSFIFKIRFIVLELEQRRDTNIFFMKRDFVCAVEAMQVLHTVIINKSPATGENSIHQFEWSVLCLRKKDEFSSMYFMMLMESRFKNYIIARREEIKAGIATSDDEAQIEELNLSKHLAPAMVVEAMEAEEKKKQEEGYPYNGFVSDDPLYLLEKLNPNHGWLTDKSHEWYGKTRDEVRSILLEHRKIAKAIEYGASHEPVATIAADSTSITTASTFPSTLIEEDNASLTTRNEDNASITTTNRSNDKENTNVIDPLEMMANASLIHNGPSITRSPLADSVPVPNSITLDQTSFRTNNEDPKHMTINNTSKPPSPAERTRLTQEEQAATQILEEGEFGQKKTPPIHNTSSDHTEEMTPQADNTSRVFTDEGSPDVIDNSDLQFSSDGVGQDEESTDNETDNEIDATTLKVRKFSGPPQGPTKLITSFLTKVTESEESTVVVDPNLSQQVIDETVELSNDRPAVLADLRKKAPVAVSDQPVVAFDFRRNPPELRKVPKVRASTIRPPKKGRALTNKKKGSIAQQAQKSASTHPPVELMNVARAPPPSASTAYDDDDDDDDNVSHSEFMAIQKHYKSDKNQDHPNSSKKPMNVKEELDHTNYVLYPGAVEGKWDKVFFKSGLLDGKIRKEKMFEEDYVDKLDRNKFVNKNDIDVEIYIDKLPADKAEQIKTNISMRPKLDNTDSQFGRIQKMVTEEFNQLKAQKETVIAEARETLRKKKKMAEKDKDKLNDVIARNTRELHELEGAEKTNVFLRHPDSLVAIRELQPHESTKDARYEAISAPCFLGEGEDFDKHTTFTLARYFVRNNFDADFLKILTEHGKDDENYIHLEDIDKNLTEADRQNAIKFQDHKGKILKKRETGECNIHLILQLKVVASFENRSITPKEKSWFCRSVPKSSYQKAKTRQDEGPRLSPWLAIPESLIEHDDCFGKVRAERFLADLTRSRIEVLRRSGKSNVNEEREHIEDFTDLLNEKLKEKIPDLTDFPQYTTGHKQISSIRYCKDRDFYYGRVVECVDNGRRKYSNETLTAEWVDENLTQDFQELLKEKANSKKFLWIPVGSSSDKVYPYKYNYKYPKIVYHQGARDTCISSSFASCLHHLGYQDAADWLQVFGSNCLDDASIDKARLVQKIVFEMHICCKKFMSKWQFQKVNPLTFDIWNLNDTEKLRPKLLIPVGNDGGTGHAFTIYNGMIFDSNLKYAVELNELNLEFCIQTVYEGVLHGYELIAKPEIVGRAKKRNRLRRELKKRYRMKIENQEVDRNLEENLVSNNGVGNLDTAICALDILNHNGNTRVHTV